MQTTKWLQFRMGDFLEKQEELAWINKGDGLQEVPQCPREDLECGKAHTAGRIKLYWTLRYETQGGESYDYRANDTGISQDELLSSKFCHTESRYLYKIANKIWAWLYRYWIKFSFCQWNALVIFFEMQDSKSLT